MLRFVRVPPSPRRFAAIRALPLLYSFGAGGCAADAGGDAASATQPDASDGAAGTGTGADALVDVPDANGGACGCTPGAHNDHIFVLSQDAELFSYDPVANSFAFVANLPCPGTEASFSMAVDARGRAWVLYADSHDLFTVDVNAPATCQDPGFVPDPLGFGLFGMGFAAGGAGGPCSKLYAFSYSGSGPFGEGAGLGRLGVIDPETATLTAIGSVDFDGGELSGTGNGRLFAFTGVQPVKLVEYDKSTALEISRTPLGTLSKTNASAFAFFGGDIYLFTEAPPAGCDACLDAHCKADADTCRADPACAADLQCAIEAAGIDDSCGGSLSQALQTCVAGTCLNECLPNPQTRVSQVTRMDYDESEGSGKALTLAKPAAPIRIVGAGSSPCVPVEPR